jgi:hypothetical protein
LCPTGHVQSTSAKSDRLLISSPTKARGLAESCLMPESKARKKVDENFKVAAVQRLLTGSQPTVVDCGLIAAIARIESEISSLDNQRQALKMAVEILRQRSGAGAE